MHRFILWKYATVLGQTLANLADFHHQRSAEPRFWQLTLKMLSSCTAAEGQAEHVPRISWVPFDFEGAQGNYYCIIHVYPWISIIPIIGYIGLYDILDYCIL